MAAIIRSMAIPPKTTEMMMLVRVAAKVASKMAVSLASAANWAGFGT